MGASQVDVAVLQDVCNKIFDFILRESSIRHVDLQENLYWSLPDTARHNMEQNPVVENVGSLADDYEFVLAATKDADQAIPMLFEHIAPLLQALATKVPNYR